MDDEYTSRPKITPDKIDFSEFHPLDHSLVKCVGYPGGPRTHLRYRWEFQWRGDIMAATLCRLGRHDPAQWWSRSMTWKGCIHCGKRLSEPQPE